MSNLYTEIIKEKSNFLQKNSTYFHNIYLKKQESFNLLDFEEKNSIIYLRRILFNQLPLKNCTDYNDLVELIKSSNTRNCNSKSYINSILVLNDILTSTNHLIDDENKKAENRDIFRKYQYHLHEQTIYMDEIKDNISIDVEHIKKKS